MTFSIANKNIYQYTLYNKLYTIQCSEIHRIETIKKFLLKYLQKLRINHRKYRFFYVLEWTRFKSRWIIVTGCVCVYVYGRFFYFIRNTLRTRKQKYISQPIRLCDETSSVSHWLHLNTRCNLFSRNFFCFYVWIKFYTHMAYMIYVCLSYIKK